MISRFFIAFVFTFTLFTTLESSSLMETRVLESTKELFAFFTSNATNVAMVVMCPRLTVSGFAFSVLIMPSGHEENWKNQYLAGGSYIGYWLLMLSII